MPVQLPATSSPRYPAFGIPCGEPEKLHYTIDFFQKSVTCISALGTIAGLALSAQVPVFVIIGTLSAITFVALAAIQMIAKITEHQRKISFEDIQVPSNGVALGEWTNNNDVLVSNRVEDSFQFKKAIIAQAKKSLEISFNYGGGRALKETLAIIDQRMQLFPELKVHILVSSDVLGRDDAKQLLDLKNKYLLRFEYVVTGLTLSISPRPHAGDNHCKMIIVDGKYFATGGSGIDDNMVRERLPENSGMETRTFRAMMVPGCFRDTDVFGRGDLAPLMREQFFRLYHIWEYRTSKNLNNRFFATDGRETFCPEMDSSPRLIAQTRAKFLISGPEHRLNNPIVNELAKRVERAQREVMIASPTFMPPPKLRDALLQRLANRVSITGFFGGITFKDYFARAAHTWPGRSHYNLLSEANEAETPNQFFHKKVCLFDDRYAMVGTFNISQKSSYWDYEDVLFFNDPRVHAALKAGLEEDRASCRRISGQELNSIYNSPLTHIKAAFVKNVVGHFTC